ncbi:NAD(P)-dependent oxidoreductase [Hahella sp. CCB-MM4]|uniref:SDR family oxidoreductase n=1 Tax=Hahella sp. (strain CCB-MM4) TaxID=1926491 RepID=UPI000B9A343F|nr:SDR family oxidoreductase [Hahella sp. CCB-MM4]OZG71327.1 NAD(P)-dependent oxidoreductase [Hahella sp. CCB-MM4]
MARAMLITGGTRGIGASLSRLAVEQGYQLCLTYRSNKDEALRHVDQLRNSGAVVKLIQLDVRDKEAVEQAFKAAGDQFGQIDVLVNNAGIVAPSGRMDTFSASRIENIFATNVFGSIYCSQCAVKQMSSRYGGKGGVIVNVSSIASKLGSPGEYVDYAASKGAVDSLTIGLAKEVADENIRVNAVRPGIIYTDIHRDSGDINRPDKLSHAIPMKRPGQPEEVARSILWLASDDASYVTGAILDVSGGR